MIECQFYLKLTRFFYTGGIQFIAIIEGVFKLPKLRLQNLYEDAERTAEILP